MRPNNDYDYTSAGFDNFLSRSVDETSRHNLNSPGPVSTAMRFDGPQVSGALGDNLRIGNIQLDGQTGRISIYDGDNEVVRIGELDD